MHSARSHWLRVADRRGPSACDSPTEGAGMQIRIRIQQGTLLVHPSGRLTSQSAEELLAEVTKELAPQPRDIALDLGDIETISAGALPYVFRIQQQAVRDQHRMVVTAVSPPVQRLLDQTRVTDNLDVADPDAVLMPR